MRSRRRTAALLACGILAALIGFELLLQALSVGTWLLGSSGPSRVASDTPRILCVGDSFTYGLGATSRETTYPSRLGESLAQAGIRAQVVNCGWPGSTSADLLGKLSDQLDSYEPAVVYVLTGCNDVWRGKGAETATNAAVREGFRLEFRTLRFLELVSHWWTTGGNTQGALVRDEVPFLGEWHAGPLSMHFLPDGRVESEGGHMTWSADAAALVLVDPGKQLRIEATWQIEDDELVLASAVWPAPLRFARGPLVRHDVDRGRLALRDARIEDAEGYFRKAIDSPALEDEARLGLIRALVARGQRDAADRELAALELRFREAPTTARGIAWIEACLALDARESAADATAEVLRAVPWDSRLLELTVQCGQDASNPENVRDAIHAGLTARAVATDLHAMFLEAAATLATDDGVAAVRDMARSYLVGGSPARFRKALLQDPDLFPLEDLEAAISGFEPADAEKVRAVVSDLGQHGAAVSDRLTQNLERIVDACRRAGAEPILLSYPKSMPDVEVILTAFARRERVPLLRVREAFDEALRTLAYRDLFVLDGHCNDRGYALLAQQVAADAAARLR